MKGMTSTWRAELGAWGVDREALWLDRRSIGFDELASDVDDCTAMLDSAGLVAGDFVGLLAPPSRAGFALIHALLDRGIVMVPLNLRQTATELRSAVEAAGLRWLFVSHETRDIGSKLAEASGCGVVTLASFEAQPVVYTIESPPVVGDDDRCRALREEMRGCDAALVLFTSGTSGRPKGAVLSGGNLRASAAASIELLGADDRDRWLCCLPLFHIGGLSILIRSVLAGTSVALHPRFDARAVSVALDDDRITRVSFVATMLAQVLEVRGKRRAPSGLDVVLLGGGPASRSLLSRAHALGYPVAPTYGLTEAASQVATRPPTIAVGDDEELAGGLVPLPGTELRISGSTLPEDGATSTGEIEVRGPTVMQGYLGDPEATARVLRGGWLATGDIGRLDSAGALRVLDRRSDLIVSGGENVYPAEIESVLMDHSDVDDVGVAALADEVYGQRPCAYVVMRSGRPIDIESLEAFCSARLAKYKIPVEWVELEALPRTASGKLIRRELQHAAPPTRTSSDRGPSKDA
jgi:O-succinylbenzoic acid--CoA ligase